MNESTDPYKSFDEMARYQNSLIAAGYSKAKARNLTKEKYADVWNSIDWANDPKARSAWQTAKARNQTNATQAKPKKLPGIDTDESNQNGSLISAADLSRWYFGYWAKRKEGVKVGDIYSFSPEFLMDIYELFTGYHRTSPAFTNEFTPGQSSKLQSDGWAFEPLKGNGKTSSSYRITAIPSPKPDPDTELRQRIAEMQRKLQELMDGLNS